MATQDVKPVKKIVVIGAGVVGLTTALRIQERDGYHVTIIADVLPSDPKTIRYTSHWAGAHHVLNIVKDEAQHRMELETFDAMWELSAPGNPAEGCFMRLPQTEYYCAGDVRPPFELMPDYKELPKDSLPPGAAHGLSFSTVTIDTPAYLNYLLSRFIGIGGTIVRGTVQHVSAVVEGGARIFSPLGKAASPPDAVVVCTGLATRFLGGVEDINVYPIRGQTVLIEAPWIKFGRTIVSEDGTVTYIIPRRRGDVIIGGTRVDNDWFPTPRPEITRDILERTFSLCPELAPPEVRAEREPTVEDVLPLIVEEGCGLRPARRGGIRLEVEWVKAGKGDGQVPVIFNYGHAGYGFQTSWGSATRALKLLESAFNEIAISKSTSV